MCCKSLYARLMAMFTLALSRSECIHSDKCNLVACCSSFTGLLKTNRKRKKRTTFLFWQHNINFLNMHRLNARFNIFTWLSLPRNRCVCVCFCLRSKIFTAINVWQTPKVLSICVIHYITFFTRHIHRLKHFVDEVYVVIISKIISFWSLMWWLLFVLRIS